MTTNPFMSPHLVNVRGTELLASDTRERYRQKLARITLDSMVQFVGLLDARGTVLEINQVALDGVGLRLSDVEGKPFWQTFWWQVSEEVNRTLRESILRVAQGESVRWDTEIYGRAGGKETIIIDASFCPVMDERGNVVFITAEGRDITEKKAHEREIARQREELAKLDELKTRFFSNVSHEFRTPLTLMLGPLEDAMADAQEPLGAQQRERVTMAQRNGLRLQKLVNTLLDFSRAGAGRIHASYQPTDLSSLTHDLASSFRSACDKAGLTLVLDTPRLSEPVFVDREMWEKIVLNLVSNAFKFTLEGGIRIGMSSERGHAVLRVSDTGTGIPESEVPRLFDRFHRVEGARGRTHEGTGIGLALVKELIELHMGTVSVESALDRGTTFIVRLPFGSAHLPQERLEAFRTQASTATRADAFVSEALRWLPDRVPVPELERPGEGLPEVNARIEDRPRILIADDNADMREYLSRLLAVRHEIIAVADGEEALAAARQTHFDLILTDVMMPRLDGFALLEKLRADPVLRSVPVVVLSARAGEDAKIEGLKRGADDYLVKPFSARELLARVAANIELSRSRWKASQALREEARVLELLNKVGTAVVAELELDRAVQVVTDAATELTGAAFGAFFYNVLNERGECYQLYALSGASRDAFSEFPMPRNTALFASTFNGEGIVRSDDIQKDPRYGKNHPNHGMPKGHLPLRSYLAAPVMSRSGELLGGLFFGHPDPGAFTDRAERLLLGIAAQAAIAVDNARLHQAAQAEIAERKRTEAALRESEERQARLNQSLEAIVAERTRSLALANEQLRTEAAEREKVEFALRQAQKMEAVGKLTGGVAHDFNNLLQVIGGNLQLLTKDVAGNERAEQRLRNAIAGVSRGSKLASQLLSFGRRQPLAPKIVNVARFIYGMDDMLRRALGEGIEVEIVTSAAPWNALVDTSQVENAILNLAINARDAMEGLGKLTIAAGNVSLTDDFFGHAEVDPGQYVMLAVTDTGPGIAPEIIEHVFEPFFATKPEGHGTGLGLSMVYGFVKQSNGHVKIYSESGVGTTIRIYLPRVLQPEDVASEGDDGPVVGGSETILVVEDDEEVRGTVVELLSDLGYGILTAKDAQGALAIVESGAPIDLIFTDVVMPGSLRSPELARQARERLPCVAVLFTSGYTDNVIVHAGRLDPGVELLSKPYTREALARKIRHVLRNQQQLDAAAGIGKWLRMKPQARKAGAEQAMTILFVEDDNLVRMATSELLSELGHIVLQAGNGAEALRILGECAIDVLMTDLGLPDMPGQHLAAQARQRFPALPVIFATGDDASATTGENSGMRAFVLRKPYDAASLVNTLERARDSSQVEYRC
jgi:PAS domain S-box-containing protein